jgi:hypothetical protein
MVIKKHLQTQVRPKKDVKECLATYFLKENLSATKIFN